MMKASMQYPVETPAEWHRAGHLSLAERMAVAWRSARYRRRAGRWSDIGLTRIGGPPGHPDAGDLILICVVKNAEKYLPSLLAHYRRLGIGRFAFVDDRSEDRTRALLLEQGDVDLYESDTDFRGSAGGLLWRDRLVDLYGRDRWYVSIDADEYLVYPGSEHRPLRDFIADLQRHGAQRSLAVMLDIYPDGALGEVEAAASPESFPTAICPLYDGTGYRIAMDKFCTAVRGGPRHRMFGADMRLTKFPVLFADRRTQFTGGSHHGPLPLDRNFSPVRAVLLHFKFPAGSVQEFRAVAERGSHFDGSLFYRQIVEHAAFGDDADFRYHGSRRFKGSEDLIAGGFMQDLRPSSASLDASREAAAWSR